LLAGSLHRPTALPLPAPPPLPSEEPTIDIELPRMSGDGIADFPAAAAHLSLPLARGGGEDMPRPDMNRKGRGGEDTAPEPALNLSDRDEGMPPSPELRSRLDRSQIQRIRAARERASLEDWRASREPMELTFLAGGSSATDRPERRTPSEHD